MSQFKPDFLRAVLLGFLAGSAGMAVLMLGNAP